MDDEWKPIELSARAFGHLSQGLYRTPAGAIKELISNAFDADSNLVRIHTDFPRFMTFSCEDFGTGMPLKEFDRLVHKGIGDSLKRQRAKEDRARPGIGRLGLGILALAIICTQFDIESHHADSRTAFKGKIKFLPYTREEMDKIPDEVKNSSLLVAGGSYISEAIKFDPQRPALRIFTSHMRDSFQKVMRNLESFGNKKSTSRGDTFEPYSTFDAFLDSIYNPKSGPVKSLNLRSEYDQLLFGLALSPPLPLLAKRDIAINLPRIKERQETLVSYDFSLEVDNLRLYNPVCLPSDREKTPVAKCTFHKPETKKFPMKDGAIQEECAILRRSVRVTDSDLTFNLYDFEYRGKAGGRPLVFSGYLFQQTGRLYPRDIQGVLIRINNIAIGKYDNSLLTYPLAEGPRFSMVSAELFIAEGFEDALNVDRDSFNELHPHYIRLQSYLHALLGTWIFPETWTEEKARNAGRREQASAAQQAQFSKSFKSATGSALGRVKRVETQPTQKDELSFRDSPIDFTSSGVEVDQTHPVLHALRRRKKITPVIERIVIAFERANAETSSAKRREMFYKILIDIFGES